MIAAVECPPSWNGGGEFGGPHWELLCTGSLCSGSTREYRGVLLRWIFRSALRLRATTMPCIRPQCQSRTSPATPGISPPSTWGYHKEVLREYLRAAMRSATFEIIEDDGSFYGRIPALEGVWANAAKLEDCRAELKQVLEEWLLLRLSERLRIPEIDGLELTVRQEVA